jgi:hypothetical protein
LFFQFVMLLGQPELAGILEGGIIGKSLSRFDDRPLSSRDAGPQAKRGLFDGHVKLLTQADRRAAQNRGNA